MRQSREGTCSVEGCDRPIKARGWCERHYVHARRHGAPMPALDRYVKKQCSVEGCQELARAKGMCARHYMAAMRHGDPLHIRQPMPLVCTVPGCERPTRTNGLCSSHHWRLTQYGSVDYVRPPPVVPVKPGMLSPEQVRGIRQLKGKAALDDVAAQYRTTVRTVIAIQAGRTWGRHAK